MNIRFPLVCCAAFACASALMAQTSAPPDKSNTAEKAITLDAFKVTAADDNSGYNVSTASTATLLATPLKDIPQTVSVVTSSFLADINAQSISDAVKYIPGVERRNDAHIPSQLIIRGFLVNSMYQDGFHIPNSNYDLANIERIEVIKGPGSAMIGRGEVGGAANFVTKQPLAVASNTLTATVGGDEFYRLVADSTGPVNKSGSLLYRAIGVYQDNDGWRFTEHTRKKIFYPSLTWQVSENTRVTATMQFLDIDAPGLGSAVYITSRTPGNPTGLVDQPTARDSFLGEAWDHRRDSIMSGIVNVEHKFGDGLLFRQGIQYSDRRQQQIWAQLSPTVTLNSAGDILLARNYTASPVVEDDFRAQGDLVAKYDFLHGQHVTLVGYEYGYAHINGENYLGSLTAINYTHPVYGALPTNVKLNTHTLQRTKNVGYPIQQQSAFFNGMLKVLAGVRFDSVDDTTKTLYPTTVADKIGSRFGKYTASTRYGITISPWSWLSLYAVESKDDQPEFTTAAYNLLPASDPRSNETLHGAQTSTLHEAGVKAELFHGRVSVTASVFHTVRNDAIVNVVQTNPDGSIYNKFYLSDGDDVKGFESQMFGEVNKNLTFVASYSTTKGTTSLGAGRIFINSIPKSEVSAFLNYKFSADTKDGFSVRAGFKRIGRMWGAANDLFLLPAQHKADLGATYVKGRYKVDLTLNNVFDDDYIEAAPASTVLAYSAPRLLYLTFSTKF